MQVNLVGSRVLSPCEIADIVEKPQGLQKEDESYRCKGLVCVHLRSRVRLCMCLEVKGDLRE